KTPGLEDAVRSLCRGERCTYVLNSGLKTLDNKTLSSSFFLGLAACLVSVIIILPRSQFSNVIPLAIYFCVFFPVFSAFAKKSKYIMSSPVSDRG
ncbi:hypothetical protein KUC90_33000, partial [Pseudomonas aeruginosa]|uniref:hypothetical protein n=1 Tax=Pseudomonas aeruginosa TaxID=287 RepID=UPI0021E1A7BE